MHTKNIEYKDGDTVLEGYLAYDDSQSGPRPVVMIAHDWTGRRDFPCKRAEQMAAKGYIGFAIDMYGKGIFGKDGDVDGNSALMGPLAGDRNALRSRIKAALEAVKGLDITDNGKIAAMGYCFGGMCVLELARAGADVAGVISIHGIFSPGGIPNEQISAKVLCLHGHDDPMVPPEQVVEFETEMTDAGVDWQVHAYGGTLHAFTNPNANDPAFGTQYNADADRRSTQSLNNFLEEIFS